MLNNPYQTYKEQSLTTLAPGEVLVKLFDETVKQLNIAHAAIEKTKDFAVANDSLNKAQTIVSTLDSSLDTRFAVSAELHNMYVFLARQIESANLKKDTGMIDDAVFLVRELRDSFEQAEKISRKMSCSMRGRAAV